MSNYTSNYNYDSYSYETEVAQNTLIKNVYWWMAGALTISGLTAWYVANSQAILTLIFGNTVVFYGLIIAELALVLGLTAGIKRISAMTATLLFLLYSVINGATLSSIFLIYSLGSIATTFGVTAGTFGAMALYGSTTKTDLTQMGKILIMGLIGLVIATLVNLFLHNSMLDLIVSGIGVLLFTGLTAYDTQKIKNMFQNQPVNEMTQKFAVLGALTLYLDFVNLFLYLLRFLGKRE